MTITNPSGSSEERTPVETHPLTDAARERKPSRATRRATYRGGMPHDEDKSQIGARLTGVRDPKDPDGLLTVDEAGTPPDPLAYGHEETDTLERERELDERRRHHDA